MKIQAHLGRAALVAAALAVVGASASLAHDPQGDVARLQREVETLRTEKNALQDQNLELARRHDTDRRRMQIQLEAAQKQIARLEAGAGGAAAPASPLDAPMEVTFDLSLTDAAEHLQALTSLPVEVQGGEGVKVRLRTGSLPGRAVLDLIVKNAQDAAGQWVELRWTQGDDGTITIRRR